MSDGAVCRLTLVTPGLLINIFFVVSEINRYIKGKDNKIRNVIFALTIKKKITIVIKLIIPTKNEVAVSLTSINLNVISHKDIRAYPDIKIKYLNLNNQKIEGSESDILKIFIKK